MAAIDKRIAKIAKHAKRRLQPQNRIVYFATHGLVAGDIKHLAEPALAFSFPDKATSQDDGLLTASEVTELKLKADWLVMSACNTAASSPNGQCETRSVFAPA